MAQRLDALRETTARRQWRAKVLSEWENWSAALEWTLAKQGNVLLGQRLVGALETAWWILPEAEARRWIRAAFEASDDMTPRNVRARLNLALARLRIQHNRFNACRTAAERALAQSRAVGDDAGIARAEFLIGHSLVVLGRLADGERSLRSALQAFRRLGARRSVARTLVSLAVAREHADDTPTAISLCTEAVETLKAIEGDDGEIDYVSYLAELEFRAGNAQEAVRFVAQALTRHREQDDRLHIAVDLSNAAAYLIALGRYDEARANAREALALASGDKNALWVAFAMQHLAAIAALQGDGARAARLLGFIDARLAELEHQREHTEAQEHQRIITALRSTFDNGAFEGLLAEGRSWNEDRAIEEAAR